MPACSTTQHGAPTARIKITRAAANDVTIRKNAHIACGREKLSSHPTGNMWTMFKDTALEKNIRSSERAKTEICNMSSVHSALSIMRMMIHKENDGICKEWKGQEIAYNFRRNSEV